MEIRHLRYFKEVADQLSFRKAAEKLHIAQPGLSRQIRLLEEELGCQLFERDKRKVRMTRAGIYFQRETEYLLNHLTAVVRQARKINEGLAGELRIGYVGSAMHTVAPALLEQLHLNYPLVSTTLHEMDNQSQIDQLLNDELDIGFVRVEAVPEHLKMVQLHRDTFSVVLPKSHPLTEETFLGVEQLAFESFILFSSDYSPHYYEKILSICEDQGFYPKVSHRSVHAYTIFKLVESGMGVAIIPTSLKYGYNLQVKFLELNLIPQETTLSAVWSLKSRNPALSTISKLIENKKPVPKMARV
jgi:DNA-binding transcriptional LysR family regulator